MSALVVVATPDPESTGFLRHAYIVRIPESATSAQRAYANVNSLPWTTPDNSVVPKDNFPRFEAEFNRLCAGDAS